MMFTPKDEVKWWWVALTLAVVVILICLFGMGE